LTPSCLVSPFPQASNIPPLPFWLRCFCGHWGPSALAPQALPTIFPSPHVTRTNSSIIPPDALSPAWICLIIIPGICRQCLFLLPTTSLGQGLFSFFGRVNFSLQAASPFLFFSPEELIFLSSPIFSPFLSDAQEAFSWAVHNPPSRDPHYLRFPMLSLPSAPPCPRHFLSATSSRVFNVLRHIASPRFSFPGSFSISPPR